MQYYIDLVLKKKNLTFPNILAVFDSSLIFMLLLLFFFSKPSVIPGFTDFRFRAGGHEAA